MALEPVEIAEQGKHAFEEKRYGIAAELFNQAAEGFSADRDGLMAAEMKNNMSVALLRAGKSQEALDTALGTDEYFAGAKDLKRQAMALGNQAAALEALGRLDEAMEKYDLSAELFGRVGEGDLRAMVKKSSATINLKKGRIFDSAYNMLGALDSKETPSTFERILKFFLRLIK